MADQEKERRAAWLAIRCAASIAQAQRCRELLIGDPSVTSQVLNDKAKDQIPDFVALDLVSAYVLGEKKKVYKSKYILYAFISLMESFLTSFIKQFNTPICFDLKVPRGMESLKLP